MNIKSLLTAAVVTSMLTTFSAAADSPLLRAPDARGVMKVKTADGGVVSQVVSIESGYGFNADTNCRALVVVDKMGNISPLVGGCGTTVMGDFIRNGVPVLGAAALHGKAARDAATIEAAGQVAAAKATKPTQITNSVTAHGGGATNHNTNIALGGQGGSANVKVTQQAIASAVARASLQQRMKWNNCQSVSLLGAKRKKPGC